MDKNAYEKIKLQPEEQLRKEISEIVLEAKSKEKRARSPFEFLLADLSLEKLAQIPIERLHLWKECLEYAERDEPMPPDLEKKYNDWGQAIADAYAKEGKPSGAYLEHPTARDEEILYQSIAVFIPKSKRI